VGSMSDLIRIMIVEDHAVVRQGLAALLRTVPDFSIVAEASDGRKAIELFRLHQPDVTLMDLRLPQTFTAPCRRGPAATCSKA
jgi:two-component system NarL family response regulator